MADTTFVQGTVIASSWLNAINDFFYTLFQASTTAAQARAALGITDGTADLVLNDLTVDNLTVNNSATITNDLSVGDDVTIGGDLSVTGTTTTTSLHVTSNADIDGDLNVDGNVVIDGTLSVGGATTFTGDVTFNGDVIGIRQWCQWAIGDQDSVITTGTAKFTFPMPAAGSFLSFQAFVNTVSSSGTPTFDVNVNGSTILSTKITIDANEKNSLTAAVPCVISSASFAAGDIVTIDIDTAGTGAIGPIISARVRWS